MDFGASFVNANTEDDGGRSPLLWLCQSYSWSAESIAVLIQRNADLLHRDGGGTTCLHHLLSSFRYCPYRLRESCGRPHWYNESSDPDPSKWIHRYSAAIILLIKHGADVYAVDSWGHSVSDVAYRRWDRDRRDKIKSEQNRCARGDIWDFSLAVCGYDISEFRRTDPREVCYREEYTRQDFEDLWAGHENLCPYYDDEENHLSDTGAVAGSDEAEEWFTSDSEDEGSDVDEVEEEEWFTTDSEDEGSDVDEVEEED